MYKIRRRRDGLYSTGGQWPNFHKVGKTWSKLGHIKAYLNCFFATNGKPSIEWPYEDCDVVEFGLVEVATCGCVEELAAVIAWNKEERWRVVEENARAHREEHERKKLAELKSKYEK